MVNNLPIKKWRSGAIQGVIWSNKREFERDGVKQELEFKTFSLERSWKDKDTWRNERLNLRRQDIPKLQAILDKIQENLYLSPDGKGEDEDDSY